ncbi:hypothetical protein CRG98_035103 [Punica granatum]|uniref:Uncharacterized protein n=1 Tax=Punica granatum TaxID=22663 RepID=A0A2I0IMD2_PUNGR|nr:hypothetical protein CRG98_035103 [Punica granatum]
MGLSSPPSTQTFVSLSLYACKASLALLLLLLRRHRELLSPAVKLLPALRPDPELIDPSCCCAEAADRELSILISRARELLTCGPPPAAFLPSCYRP